MNMKNDISGEHWSSPNGCHPDCPACARENPPQPKKKDKKRHNLQAMALKLFTELDSQGQFLFFKAVLKAIDTDKLEEIARSESEAPEGVL
jgi:hypothetical protein